MKKKDWYILSVSLAIVMIVGLIAHLTVVRIDLTDDHRYSLHQSTKQLLRSIKEPIEVTIYLSGEVNASFRRLATATGEMADELGVYAPVRSHFYDEEEDQLPHELKPIVVHEKQRDGKTAQTPVYPFAKISYKGRYTIVSLLNNNRQLSGEENLNVSIENLEYAFAEAIVSLRQKESPKIAFLEGHHETPEPYTVDITSQLSRYFQVDRGTLAGDPYVLDGYKVVIVADPQLPFSEQDKFILDQYIMRGGRVLWLVNGVQVSDNVLAEHGFTPVIPLDLHLTDMFFRYGFRINPALVQDVQCLPIPVNVSTDDQPNFQPMPWYYAPLLLTSQESAITRNITQVSCSFASPIDAVGNDDAIRKHVLLATSTASRLIATPTEVDLGDMNPDLNSFKYQYIPVAVALEGAFPSVFAHRMVPEGINSQEPPIERSRRTKQIVVAAGSVIRNEIAEGEALPAGYDRYSGMQFGNRDFLVNAVLYLADDAGLIELRQKTIELRLLNERRAYSKRTQIQLISTCTPVLMLALLGGILLFIRKRKYTK